MSTPLFSIIIPEYCGAKYIDNCFKTIINQNLDPEDYEIIFVDDASPDNSVDVIKDHIAKHKNINTQLIVHQANTRPGGGRNTGIAASKGDYVVFLDVDDEFNDGALLKLKDEIKKSNTHYDLIAVDYNLRKNGIIDPSVGYNNAPIPMSGREYMMTQQIPWVPWCYLYRRQYILDNGFRFQENAVFDDKDFVIRATVKAKSIRFYPIKTVIYNVWDGQTSTVGNDFRKIHDLFWISYRTRKVAEEIANDNQAKIAVLNHHWFSHKENIKKYLWRLNFKQQVEILNKFPSYTPSPHKVLNLSAKHPKLFALSLQIIKPVMPLVRKAFLTIKKYRS